MSYIEKRREELRTSQSTLLSRPSDWENYLLTKEGIESYKNHNLPLTCSCPGLYELGVASARTNLDSKIDLNGMITVYPGQADNNRSTTYPNADINLVYQRGPRLFREMVSKGFSTLENKEEANKTEIQPVCISDYAWNTGGNGPRRPNDILPKLDKIDSSTSLFPNVARELQQFVFGRLRQIQQWLLALEQSFIGKKSGVQIKLVSETKSDASNDQTNDDSHSRVFKFGRTQPRLVFDKCDMHKEDAVILKPVRGRKRCQEHKWKRIIGCVPESVVCGVNLKDGSPVSRSNTISDRKSESEENCTIICGILLRDGSVCNVEPIEGRKRCGEHKGQRVKEGIASVVCGVGLGDGSVCSKNPLRRKRCEMHKGRWITSVS
ncbi:hypothetical protein MKW92_003169 [Papaver armeniacum]|nr:hypothetical protein MKW92_003169 [Papaver armeniacum]